MERYLRKPLRIEQLFEVPAKALCNYDLYVPQEVTIVDESTRIYLDDCVDENDVYPPFAQKQGLKWLLFGNMVEDSIVVWATDSRQELDLTASLENFFYYCTIRTVAFQFPKVEITDDELPYMVSGDFSRYLLAQYTSGNMTELQKGLDLIEKFLHSKYYKVQELATVGYLEDIQTIWENSGTDPELIFDRLGAESKRIWVKLNAFWQEVIMAKNKVGTDPFLDALAVYKTELAKGSPEKQFNQIHKLVKELPDINHQDKSGMTYLSIAVRQFKDDIVQMLLENGADPNICDNLGVSPLAYAFLKQLPNTKRIIELLLQFGADPSLGKTPKHTPFYYAHITQAEPEWVDMLQEANVKLHGAPFVIENI